MTCLPVSSRVSDSGGVYPDPTEKKKKNLYSDPTVNENRIRILNGFQKDAQDIRISTGLASPHISSPICFREAAKKGSTLVVRPLGRGGGVKPGPLRKRPFFGALKTKLKKFR